MTERLTWVEHSDGRFLAQRTVAIESYDEEADDYIDGTERVTFDIVPANTEAAREHGDPIDCFYWVFPFLEDTYSGEAPTLEAAKAEVEKQAMELNMFMPVTQEGTT